MPLLEAFVPLIEPEFLEITRGLNLAGFWQENDRCQQFTKAKPRCPVHLSPDDHWLFGFVGVPSTLRYYRDKEYRDALHKEVNAITREYVGRAFFDEDTIQNPPRRIENLFDCEFAYHEGGTPWLVAPTDDPREFEKTLNRAARTDMRTWALPDAFLREWEERKATGRTLPLLGTGSRGPATIYTSVVKPEVFFYWVADYPEMISRFRDILAQKMVELNTVLREFSGSTAQGWWITDDNSALFSPKLYREYCFPVLKRVLEAMAPGAALRYQHSDSAMGHLMPQQWELGIRRVNYGPEIDVADIRAAMPGAMIEGHMPPFLLRNGTAAEIEARVVSDFEKAGATGGLVVATAGSTAAGTGMGRMRFFMQVVQDRCRYQAR